MKQLPETVAAYRKTPEFDENSLPHGLTHNHQTQDGVWAKIVVLEGACNTPLTGQRRKR